MAKKRKLSISKLRDINKSSHGHSNVLDDESDGSGLRKRSNVAIDRGSNVEDCHKKLDVHKKLDSSGSKHPTPVKVKSEIKEDKMAINQFVNDKTVFVEGLPFNSSEDEVRRFFNECGKIVSVRLPRWHDSNRLRGYGHVEFSESAAVAKAHELDGCDFLGTGRYVGVKNPQMPRSMQMAQQRAGGVSSAIKPPGCRSVFIKNLPYDITEKDVSDMMMVFGPIVSVRLARWGHTNLLKGFGYVDFKREDSAEIAVKKRGQLVLKGRYIEIDFETNGPKGGFKGPKR